MRIVDEQRERAAGGEVRARPVEPVVRGLLLLGYRSLPSEERLGQFSRTTERLGALRTAQRRESRFEELANDAVGVVALELASAGRE